MFRVTLRIIPLLIVVLAVSLVVVNVSARTIPPTPLESMGYPHRDCGGPCLLGLHVGVATATDVETLLTQRHIAFPHEPGELSSSPTVNLIAPQTLNTTGAYIYISFDENDVIHLLGVRDTLCMTDVLSALGLPDDAIRHRNRSVVYSYWYGDDSIWIFHSSTRSRNEIIEVQMFTFEHFRTRERYNLSQYTPYRLPVEDYRHGC